MECSRGEGPLLSETDLGEEQQRRPAAAKSSVTGTQPRSLVHRVPVAAFGYMAFGRVAWFRQSSVACKPKNVYNPVLYEKKVVTSGLRPCDSAYVTVSPRNLLETLAMQSRDEPPPSCLRTWSLASPPVGLCVR